MANIAWGKCRLFVKDVDTSGAKPYEIATPVEDSTVMSVTKGDKIEAKIEGGANEDVKVKASTYQLNFNIRKARGRKPPFPSEDGIVLKHYGIMIMPEDQDCEGVFIESGTVSIDDTFATNEGGIWECQVDAIKPATGATVKWGTVVATTANSATSVTFTERSSLAAGGTPKTATWALDDTGNTGTPAGAVVS